LRGVRLRFARGACSRFADQQSRLELLNRQRRRAHELRVETARLRTFPKRVYFSECLRRRLAWVQPSQGRRAPVDVGPLAICLVAFVVISRVKRVPEPAVIVAAGIVGLLIAEYQRRDFELPPGT